MGHNKTNLLFKALLTYRTKIVAYVIQCFLGLLMNDLHQEKIHVKLKETGK